MSGPPRHPRPSVRRCGSKPILSAADWPYPANAIFNAGATTLPDGATLLLCRVEDHAGFSHLTAARSADGLTDWAIDPQPTFPAIDIREEQWGVEDPRITLLADGRYAICYTSYGVAGPSVSLALTTDFRTFERLGIVLPPNNKDAALFPEKINDRFAMLHRPSSGNADGGVWYCESQDLRHWGEHRLVMNARSGGWWDSAKIGLAGPPIPTDDAWLILYHGVRDTAAGAIYRVGAAILDRDRPYRVIARAPEWFLGPRTPDERTGDVGNVVFPCGQTLRGDRLRLYFGMADTSIGAADLSLSDLLEWVRSHPVEA